MMAINVDKVKLGPCKVTYDFGGGEPVVFEQTKGGVLLTYEETTREVTIDQLGDTPVKEMIIGRKVKVEVPVAEQDLSKLQVAIPGSELIIDGEKTKLVVKTKVIDLLDYAKKVKIEPLDITATENDTITLLKAAPRAKLDYKYDFNNELVTNVTFNAYPNEEGDLMVFGDESATA